MNFEHARYYVNLAKSSELYLSEILEDCEFMKHDIYRQDFVVYVPTHYKRRWLMAIMFLLGASNDSLLSRRFMELATEHRELR